MGPWAIFTIGVTLAIRWYLFHNIDISVFVWTGFALIISAILNAVVSEAVIYHVAWVLLFMVSKTPRKRMKEYYGEYGGDYDAP